MDIPGRTLLSRRGFCLCCIGSATVAATGGWLTPRQVFAQSRGIVEGIRAAAAAAPIKVHRLRGNVSVLEGSGGNIAVLTGGDGKVLVDAGIAVSRPRITEALTTLSADPIRHLINTHWHFDHADGNEWLHREGAVIVAHENARKHLASAQRVEDWNFDFPPSPAAALPSEVISADRTLRLNDTNLALRHYGPAHTDGDISVTFEEPEIVHTGDIYWSAGYPFIDYSTGGSIEGTIRATEAVLATTTDNTIVIPGHGSPTSNKAELKDYHAMLVGVRDSVAKLKKQGRTLAETIEAKPTAAYDAKWGQFVIDPAFFTRLAFAGV
jgi:glyoxylase-like metal-dependent hydrolase (beta-lactamase superfamily II)